MRVVILAGGLGTRLAEETERLPKPMIEIGGRPILWHIAKGYAAAGLRHFVIALGYRGDMIKSYFAAYAQLQGDVTVHTRLGHIESRGGTIDDWTVDLVDTGLLTNTGGRVRRLLDWLPDDEFCLTYGDGVSDVDFSALLAFHRRHGGMVTVTAVRPPARFGGLELDGDRIREFSEKPQVGEGWINGGFMVARREVIERIGSDDSSFEKDLLEELAVEGQLYAYKHERFWQCMDTLRDVRTLQALWESGDAPWQTW